MRLHHLGGLAFLLIALLTASPGYAQKWTGSAALEASGSYRTNAYLDPVLRTWDPDADGVAALAPRAGLGFETQRWTLTAGATAYLQPQSGPPYLLVGSLSGRYRLSDRWSLGAHTGGRRYRFSTNRDSWWVLPDLQWRPTSQTRLTLRSGVTRRTTRTSSTTPTQTSGLVSIRGTTWLTDRVRGTLRAYYTGAQAGATYAGYNGTGGSLNVTYWPSASVAIDGTAGLEQVRFGSADTGGSSASTRIGRIGTEVRWSPRSAVTLHVRMDGSRAILAGTDSPTTDVHVGAGATLQWNRVLSGSRSPSTRGLYSQADDGVRFQIPDDLYRKPGRLYVVGDFNGWSLPGIPLQQADGAWSAQVDVPAGRYEYRIRVVSPDGDARWLDLPSYAHTTEDAFGGINGVCIVQ